ncbi:MAG: LysR substrate-binding domain-containing protein [Alphaproteobacteria bacterium]
MDSVAGMRVFARVVEAGSFSAAGRQLGVAPSSVSRQIGDLEQDLGARLFHRTTRRLSLTEAGRMFYGHAAKILIEVDEARLAVSQLDGTPSGILRLTVPASVGRLHVVPALAAFQERYPAVQVVLSVTDRLVDLVEGGLDLAIRIGRQRDSSLIARKIGSGRRIVCASPDYLASEGVPVTPADLAGHSCLTFRSHPGSNAWQFRGPGGAEEVRVSGKLFADDGDALCAAAIAGLGLILVPAWLVGRGIEAGKLREVLSSYQAIPAATPMYAVYPHQRHLPPKVRALIDFLVERFSGETSWGARG